MSDARSKLPNTLRLRMRDEMRDRLRRHSFHHFVTLATNDQDVSIQRMRSLLRSWDQRVNRQLVGPKYLKRPDERILWFAFSEKLDLNPHWHLLVELDVELLLPADVEVKHREFALLAEREWDRICPRGSCDVAPVIDDGAIRYVTKELSRTENLENFVFHREFFEL